MFSGIFQAASGQERTHRMHRYAGGDGAMYWSEGFQAEDASAQLDRRGSISSIPMPF